MIGTFIQGGLGNQLFQIAAAYAQALRLETEFYVVEGQHHHEGQGNNISTYTDNILRKIKFQPFSSFESCGIYHEKEHSYTPFPEADGLYFVGYFQSEKYFEDCKPQIKTLFEMREEDEKIIYEKYPFLKDERVASLHVRRGDYLKFSTIHPVLSSDYYKEALERVRDRSKIMIFSDDIEWCKEKFEGDDLVFADLPEDYLDLYAMSKCYHHIVCNSSFSWWGAWLSNTKGKIIAPKTWFGPEGPAQSDDIVPDTWEKI